MYNFTITLYISIITDSSLWYVHTNKKYKNILQQLINMIMLVLQLCVQT